MNDKDRSGKNGYFSSSDARIRELERELEEMKRSEEVLRRAEMAAGTGSWELHLDTQLMYGSQGARLLYGLDDTQLDFEIIKKVPLPEYRPVLDKAMADLINEGKPYDVTFRIRNNKTGKLIDIHSVCEFDRERRILFGTLQDITDQKRRDDIAVQYNSDLSGLLKITIELLETAGKRKMLQTIIEKAVHIIGLDTGALYSIHEGELLTEANEPPLPDDFPDEFRKARLSNHPHIKKAVDTKSPVLVPDINEEELTREEAIILKNRNMYSLLYLPLIIMQKVRGVMIMGTIGRKITFTRREIDLCHTLSNIGSLALENTMLFEQLNSNIEELKSVITIKELTEGRLRLLSRAVEHSPVSILITDPQGIIEYVNPTFTQVTGFTFDEAKGNKPSIVKSEFHPIEFYRELWDRITAGKNWFGEMKNRKKNGEYYWENVLISPITDEEGGITHFVGIKEDITEKKKMVENLIAEKERAEESDRLKTAFLHNISHEIRTPLNSIVGFSTLLNDLDLPLDKRQAYIDIIISSNDQLLSIIDGIMKISQLETGQVKIVKNKTDVQSLMARLYKRYKAIASKKNLDFEISGQSEDGIIFTDESKLTQILTGLLDNAFKFTNSGQVKVNWLRKKDYLEISVGDTGIGIPQSEQERIFEHFYQAKKMKSQIYGGTGLGLSIAAGYADLLGGSLSVKSAPDSGSLFTLSIPIN
ncbi:MAG TPA: PAS domain S-box protein [Bacteroidales bacterium]|nr:PAS domain S-box protein [Bacteroidales bacterium]